MAGKKSGRSSKGDKQRRGNGSTERSGSRAAGRRSRGSNRLPQLAVATTLAIGGLLFIPVLIDSDNPLFSATRSLLQRQLGLGSYIAPALLVCLAVLLALSLRQRGYRLRWAPAVGWLAFFVGLLGLLHWWEPLGSGAPAVPSAGGSVGRAVFSALADPFGQAGAFVLLGTLAVAGAAAGLGMPLRHFVQALWTVCRFAVDVGTFVRSRVVPPGVRVARRARFWTRGAARWLGRGLASGVRLFRRAVAAAAAALRSRAPEAAAAEQPQLEHLASHEAVGRTGRAAAAKAPAATAAQSGATASSSVRQPVRPSGSNGWELPPLTLLESPAESESNPLDDEERFKALERTIEKTLADFGVPVKVVERRPGPTVTQFGVEPQFHEKRARDGTLLRREKVKVREITARATDLALALAARSIRIEAPVPGRAVVGIEVPNHAAGVVTLRAELESRAFQRARLKNALPIVLGRDVSGEVVTGDLARMPHLLIAGATGAGKSVCINSLIATILMNHTPDDLRFLMVDPKRVELALFDAIPHLLRPVVVDVEKAVPALFQAVTEMDKRYREFAALGVRNIEGYNRLAAVQKERRRLPYIVLVIDELADLMMLAADEVERTLCRLAQLARATGIHLMVATQRPSVDVVTGLIKANFPTRISFMVTSQVDSRTILDMAGAEKLLGRGDMLYLPSDAPKPLRLQGTFVSDKEIEDLTSFWRLQRGVQYATEFIDLPTWTPGGDPDAEDELYERAVELAHAHDSISVSFLQRRLRVGWNRAARLMEMLEANGELRSQRGQVEVPSEAQGEEEQT